jgi:hypothetical protein
VVEVDVGRKRIGLTMRKQAAGGGAQAGGAGQKQEQRKGPAVGKAGKAETQQPAGQGWFSAAVDASKGKK